MCDPDCGVSQPMRKIGNVSNCLNIYDSHWEGLRRQDSFQRCTISDTVSHTDGLAQMYTKDMIELLVEQLNGDRDGELVLHPDSGTYLDIAYIMDVCKAQSMSVMYSSKWVVFWKENWPSHPTYFMGLQKIAKTVSTLKSSTMVKYPVHIVLLKMSAVCWRRLTNEGYTLIQFLPVSNADEEEVSSDGQIHQSVE